MNAWHLRRVRVTVPILGPGWANHKCDCPQLEGCLGIYYWLDSHVLGQFVYLPTII